MWTAVHRQLPDAWPWAFRHPGHERLVGVEWRVWAANSPCPPVVVLPRRTSHHSWETVAALWGWVAVRETGGHVFTAPRGTVIETDREKALQPTSAASATTSLLSSTVGSAATRKWCLGPSLLPAAYKPSRAPRTSAGGRGAPPQSCSQGSAPGRCRPAPPDQTAALRIGRSRQMARAIGSRQG